MPIALEALGELPMGQRRLELVERKGLGHPDTICDSLVEAISLGLNRMYLEQVGAIAHYNIDKALLAAGRADKGFGGGRVLQPMRLIVGDRATYRVGDVELPVEDTARQAVDEWVRQHLPGVRPGRDLASEFVLAPGSEELRRIFTERAEAIASNDTCGASATVSGVKGLRYERSGARRCWRGASR